MLKFVIGLVFYVIFNYFIGEPLTAKLVQIYPAIESHWLIRFATRLMIILPFMIIVYIALDKLEKKLKKSKENS